MILSWKVGTSNCTPILYHLSHTECSALIAAFNVGTVPVNTVAVQLFISYAEGEALTVVPASYLYCIIPSGPGFVSTSPAITSNRGIITTTALSSRVPPSSKILLTWEVDSRQWQCILLLPPRPLSLDRKWTTYCSISDRATTVMQPLNTRGMSFMTSPTSQLETPGWYCKAPLFLHLVWMGRHMW